MTDDWKTLRVPVEAWEKAKEQKEETGRTWGEQIVRDNGDGEDVYDDFDRLAELVEAVPERTADEVEGRLR